MTTIRRKRYFVDRPFQFKYMTLVLLPLGLFLMALYYGMYYSIFMQILIPEAVIATLAPAMQRVNLIVLAVAPIALFIIIRVGLIYSNRIIGPIPRLERDLDRVIAGDSSVRLRTRDKDELRSFIGKVNQLLEKVDSSR